MATPAAKQVDSGSSSAATNARKRALAFTGAKSNAVAIDVTILTAGAQQRGQAAAFNTWRAFCEECKVERALHLWTSLTLRK